MARMLGEGRYCYAMFIVAWRATISPRAGRPKRPIGRRPGAAGGHGQLRLGRLERLRPHRDHDPSTASPTSTGRTPTTGRSARAVPDRRALAGLGRFRLRHLTRRRGMTHGRPGRRPAVPPASTWARSSDRLLKRRAGRQRLTAGTDDRRRACAISAAQRQGPFG